MVEQPAHPVAATPQPTQPPTDSLDTFKHFTFTLAHANSELASRGGGSEREENTNTEKVHERQNRGESNDVVGRGYLRSEPGTPRENGPLRELSISHSEALSASEPPSRPAAAHASELALTIYEKSKENQVRAACPKPGF